MALPWLAACGGGGEGDREESYRRVVERTMARHALPGVLVSVLVDEGPAWTRAFGRADLAAGTALSPESRFPIRSITKSFTVTALLQLVRERRLGLDQRIDRFVGGVPNGHLITLADLAGMQSGLANYASNSEFVAAFGADPRRRWTPEELVAFSSAIPPGFLPGERYEYSNTNTVLLGMVVARLADRSLADVLSARICTPLQLSRTTYPTRATLPSPAPTPYAVDVRSGVATRLPLISPTALAGSGAMTSTIDDLRRWGIELGRGTLIGDALHEARMRQARAATDGPRYDEYGLGIGRIGDWWGHTGSGAGFQVATMHLRRRSATIAVMVNATPDGAPPGFNFAQAVFLALADEMQASQP